MYDEGAMNEENASKWCLLSKEGENNLHEWGMKLARTLQLGKFLSILHLVPTLHQVVITCVHTARNFLAGCNLTNDQEKK